MRVIFLDRCWVVHIIIIIIVSILIDLNTCVVWWSPSISSFSNTLSKPLGIVPSAPIIISQRIQRFLSILASSKYFSLFVAFFDFHSVAYYQFYYLPTPPLGQDMTQGQFLGGVQ